LAECVLGVREQLCVVGRDAAADCFDLASHLLAVVPVDVVQAKDEGGKADCEYDCKFENVLF
jgi:hypothetical protein